jgi:hypothetical protein
MPLPSPSPRKPSHTRTVVYRGFDREDGLWDIEAELTDVKSYSYAFDEDRPVKAGQPVHGLSIRLTIDDELLIHDVATSMDHIPHATCDQAPATMHRLKGCRLGKGWRKQIDEKVGGTEGCTHLREMLFNMATAAIQTLTMGTLHRLELKGLPPPVQTELPAFLGQCHTWARGSVTTLRHFPMFYRAARGPSLSHGDGQQEP